MVGIHDVNVLPQLMLGYDGLDGVHPVHVVWDQIQKESLAIVE